MVKLVLALTYTCCLLYEARSQRTSWPRAVRCIIPDSQQGNEKDCFVCFLTS